MNLRDFFTVLRARWVIVAATALVTLLAAVATTLLSTPLYEASTRLFVSTASGGDSLTDKYQGTLFSQERVLSYTQLLTGQTLAQRTVDALGLDMTAAELAAEVTASSTPDTVLIDVEVLDASPIRARDIADALSDEFSAMARQLETPEDGSEPNARVIVEQRASVPQDPVVPQKLRNIAIGLAAGLLLGVVLALLRDYFDNTVKGEDALAEITRVGVVGSIPNDKERRRTPAIAFDRDNSAVAEAFRKLRTNLQFLAVDDPPRVIVVTSSMQDEGKSTTAINVALALAETDKSVVVVDGDMRRPTLDKYLNVVGAVGLSTVLSGGTSLADALQQTAFPGLTILASGPVPPNPSELLGSQAARRVLSDLRERFDYVVVDSSPLLAVTDAAILAANADGVLLLARIGKTKRDQITHSVKNLQGVGATLLGAVFTMTSTRDSDAYRYSYYGTGDTPQPSGTAAAPRKEGHRRKVRD